MLRPVARFAWGVLLADVGVILWGAYVRATGSGAGCGRHWPTCNGVIVPRAPRLDTLIELSHRASSGLALALTLVLFLWARKVFPAGHRVRRAAAVATALIGVEALIGAGLVLLELVAHDASLRRAVSMSVHLVNTFFLLASTALAAHWASGGGPIHLRGSRHVLLALGLPIASMLAVGASGAVTALGDTLFPAPSLSIGIAQDFAPGANAFVRLRVVHPMIACVTALGVVVASGFVRAVKPTSAVRRFSHAASGLAMAQVAAGLLDIVTGAPVSVQLVHLGLADAVWIALVLLAAAALEDAQEFVSAPRADAFATLG